MKKNCLTILAVCFFATAVMAHGGYVHLKGTITKIDGDTVSIQTPEGASKQFTVTADTKFTRKMPASGTQSADTPATLQDLQVGDRVVVHGQTARLNLRSPRSHLRQHSAPVAAAVALIALNRMDVSAYARSRIQEKLY